MKNIITIFILILFVGCTGKYEYVPEDRFVGTWELKGRSMFEGMVIEIDYDDNNQLKGRIKQLSANKYVQMLAEPNDIWISNISRNSDFRFSITEKKIGGQLFGLYGLSSSTKFKAEFIDENTIGISKKSDPSLSTITYERVGGGK